MLQYNIDVQVCRLATGQFESVTLEATQDGCESTRVALTPDGSHGGNHSAAGALCSTAPAISLSKFQSEPSLPTQVSYYFNQNETKIPLSTAKHDLTTICVN